ncbi:MAG: hypothetical protein OEM02_00185 [Desulfobulbaceae bacterium]|nr:hypothetical protein [Desulfobulbaceae bacterium]
MKYYLLSIAKKHGINIAILIILFVISIIIRKPYIDRPISHNFEWSTAHSLIVQQVWFEEGAVKNLFAQKMNFKNEADKFINNASMSNNYDEYPLGIDDSYFYLSNSSFGLIPPYLIFKLFNVYPSPLLIEWFNMFLQLACSIVLYLIIERKTRIDNQPFNIAATVAGAVYLLLPTTLWFHSNVYYIEMFVQLPFVLTVFFTSLYFDETISSKKNIFLYLLSLCLMLTVLTEWLGILLGACIFLYTCTQWKKGLDFKLLFFVASAVLLGASIFIMQNSLVVGFSNFINHELRQFIYQSNSLDNLDVQEKADYHIIWNNYLNGASAVFYLIFASAIGALSKIKWHDFRQRFGIILFLFLLPCLLHHILLSRFTTIHWFSILKSIFFLGSLLATFVYYNQFLYSTKLKFNIIFLLFIISLAPMTYHNYLYHATTGGNPHHYEIWANAVIDHANNDEVVFWVSQEEPRPQLIYYARRNIKRVDSIKDAKRWLKESETKAKKGIAFTNLPLKKFIRFSVEK